MSIETEVLSVLRPGRLYTKEDIWWRCKDNGINLAIDAVDGAVKKLLEARRIHCLALAKGGRNRTPAIFAVGRKPI